MAIDPNTMIQGLLSGTGFGQTQGQLRGQDIQNQLGQQNLQAGQLELQKAHAAQAQQAEYQTDITDYFKDPRPQKLAMLAAKYPQQAESLKQVYSIQNDQQRQSALGVMGGLFNAANAGRADLVTKNLTNVRDAERAQGVDTSEVDGLLADLNSGDAAKVKSAVTMTKGFAQMHLAAINPDKFNETYGVLGKDSDKGFTLGQGQTRYDSEGHPIASVNPETKYIPVPEGGKLIPIGPNGPIEGGGGQASGSGGGAPNSTSGSPRYTGGWTPRARNGGDNSDAAVDNKIAGAAQYLGVDPGADISKLSPMKIAQAMTLSEGGAGSLADKNNNPANIKNSDGSFKKFPTKEAGLNAAAALVARKLRNGQTTVQSLIEGMPGSGHATAQSGDPAGTIYGAPKQKDAPAGYQWAANGTLAPIPGGPADKGGRAQLKPIPQSAVKVIVDNRSTLRQIDSAIALLGGDKEFGIPADPHAHAGAIGWGTGSLGDWYTNNVGDPAGVETRAAIGKIGGQIIHDVSGAAVTLSEEPRFKPYVPTIKDNATVALQKLKNLRRLAQGTNDDYMEQYSEEQGYRPFAGGKAQQAAPVRIANAADYASLPSGAHYIDPQGTPRVKK